jgi:hypothetical protein
VLVLRRKKMQYDEKTFQQGGHASPLLLLLRVILKSGLERCEHREQWWMNETDVCAAKNAQPFLVFHCYKKNLHTRS